jgi:hypothetical protein
MWGKSQLLHIPLMMFIVEKQHAWNMERFTGSFLVSPVKSHAFMK